MNKRRITTMQVIKAESEFSHPGIGLLINNYGIRIANFKLQLAKIVTEPGLSNREKSSACKQEITGKIRNQMKRTTGAGMDRLQNTFQGGAYWSLWQNANKRFL